MKIAIVHDQLQEFGGAERVLVSLKKIYPDADVYTSFYNPRSLGIHADKFKDWNITTAWCDKIPLFKRLYSPLRFMTPLIWESFDFSKYDLVLSSSGAYMSKGVITKPPAVHICYLHHQPRYLYYYETAREWQKYWPVRAYGNLINHNLRIFDFTSSQRVDYFIANSEETKKRIEKFYRRDSTVIYPPVSIPSVIPTEMEGSLSEKKRDSCATAKAEGGTRSTNARNDNGYYLTISRLARAKHIDVLIKAANKMKFKLKIVGTGRDEKYLRSMSGPTVEFLGSVKDIELTNLYQNAKAYLFASVDEEFGIAPVEAMGHGLPVIAFQSGGLKETVHENKNGYLFHDLNEDSLIEKIKTLEKLPENKYLEMRKNARFESEKYTEKKFKEKIVEFVDSKLLTTNH